ncbi:MAG: hypothetical protein ACK5YO_25815, partial [Planctomyces sp.]
MPAFNAPIAGNGSGSFGGHWTGGADGAKAGVAFTSFFGGATDASILNRQSYIDVTYYAPAGHSVDSASILDSTPEFTISGSAIGDAVYDRVEKVSDSRYRYHFRDSNETNSEPAFK